MDSWWFLWSSKGSLVWFWVPLETLWGAFGSLWGAFGSFCVAIGSFLGLFIGKHEIVKSDDLLRKIEVPKSATLWPA